MRIIVCFFLLFLCVVSCKQQKNNFNEAASLANLAVRLDSSTSIDSLLMLQPSLTDCKTIFKSEKDAKLVFDYLTKEYGMVQQHMVNHPIHGRFPNARVEIVSIASDSAVNIHLMKYEPLLSKLNTYKLYQIQYHNKQDSFNMRFDAFAFVNNKWKYFGELTRAFK